ncbi:class I SAM-dependent methyltransferase [Parahaliea aestuarii]|uniref:class I SAM-dependent methyltransferase n=1 Tax=Parahaliea aestuarii TaxID=1852021 RepID=UPI001FE4A08F|nr:methyltransferase domain-containing protein [Parahaliea aestuarii]
MPASKPVIARKFRGVSIPTSSHPSIRKVRRQGTVPSIHGNKFWKSSALLIDYLKKHPPEHCKRVIDVGCGWGIGGIWCAKKLGAKVTAVDADPDVFPYLHEVAAINGVEVKTLARRFEQLTVKQLSKYDMLIAADICFWDELVKPVTNMVNRAVKAGVKHIYIADPERSTFLEMAERCADRHCADLIEWKTRGNVEARGAIMAIENA